jgi:hypothetical protein
VEPIDSTTGTDETNPYAPPASLRTGSQPRGDSGQRGLIIYLAWFAVLVLNLAIPLLLALPLTDDRARIGMLIAIALLCAAGCWVCANSRQAGRSLVIGGVLVGLSQLFPILQMFAGVVAMNIGVFSGLGHHGEIETLNTEIGGLVVTLITGTILMSIAAGIGFVIERLMRSRTRRAAEASAAARARKLDPT